MRRGVLATVVLATSLAFATSAPTAAHALSCSGRGCNGKNPQTYGCSKDATTVNSTTWEDGAAGTLTRQVVELRHSNACEASWARVVTTATGTAHVLYGQAYMDPYKSTTKRIRYLPGGTYSNMRAGSSVTACGKSNFNHGAVIQTHCTSAG